MGVAELRSLRQLEEEIACLKMPVAISALTSRCYRMSKKAVRSRKKRELVNYLLSYYRVSLRRAFQTVQLQHSIWFYKPHRRDVVLMTMLMKEITFCSIRYGYRRILTMLRSEGFPDNYKRMYRIYHQEGLNLRTKRPRKNRSTAQRQEHIKVTGMHQVCSIGFEADQLNGKRFRILTIMDNYSKKSPGLYADQHIKSADVVGWLNHLVLLEVCVPQRLQVEKGNDFISKDLDR